MANQPLGPHAFDVAFLGPVRIPGAPFKTFQLGFPLEIEVFTKSLKLALRFQNIEKIVEIWAENRRGCSGHFHLELPISSNGLGSGHVTPARPVRVLPTTGVWMERGKLLKGWWRLEAPGSHFAHYLQKKPTEWRETKVKRGDEVLCLPRPSQLNGQPSPSSRGSFEMGFPYLPSRVLATTWIQTACLLEDIFNLEVLELITSYLLKFHFDPNTVWETVGDTHIHPRGAADSSQTIRLIQEQASKYEFCASRQYSANGTCDQMDFSALSHHKVVDFVSIWSNPHAHTQLHAL